MSRWDKDIHAKSAVDVKQNQGKISGVQLENYRRNSETREPFDEEDQSPSSSIKYDAEEIEKQQNISANNLRQTLSGSGEEFNFTKQGEFQPKPVVEEEPGIQFHSNATYTDATGTHRDAIGREITTDMNVNKITDDVAFAAQKAGESAAETAVEKNEA